MVYVVKHFIKPDFLDLELNPLDVTLDKILNYLLDADDHTFSDMLYWWLLGKIFVVFTYSIL